jgi:8-amino-7-oxononanoate synthase
MIPPATPAGMSLVRISLSAAHSDEDITHIVAALAEHMRRARPLAAA